MFRHPFRYAFIAGLAVLTFVSTILCQVYFYFNIEIKWYLAFLTIFSVTLMIWEGNRITEPILREAIRKDKIRLLTVFFLLGNIITIVSCVIVVSVVEYFVFGYSLSENINPLKLNIIYGLLINLLFHLLNVIHEMFNNYKEQREQAEELRRNNAQAQIMLLKSQINPHFLFNNLNVLSGMVIKNNPEANHFIEEFSKVYRYILNNQEKELVELSTELEFIEPYIFLLKTRFESGLKIEIDIPERCKKFYIVPAALQMVIENAIKHNVVDKDQPLKVTVYTNDINALIVQNNLQPRLQKLPESKRGLQNISRRYNVISKRDVTVEKTDSSFKVTLPLLQVN